ncbi:phosphotransferase [Shewanella sp. GXUN23E]|uniref:phosphotransferase n=1 Tax=Shewanella sp. GXUN23E TaxID=3422498 RepID=UPI003D7D6E63
MMPGHKYTKLLQLTLTTNKIDFVESIQSLWRGYGELFRIRLDGLPLCVKFIHTNRSHDSTFDQQRKALSYQVEINWYRQSSARIWLNLPRIPECYDVINTDAGVFILMQDLKSTGYRFQSAYNDIEFAKNTIEWLAIFHACFMLDTKMTPLPGLSAPLALVEAEFSHWPCGIWRCGSYWHLATRPEEFHRTQGILKHYAALWDNQLNQARFQTIIHGDAKAENFGINHANQVAGVDFQYVGAGCGIRDVSYFLDSILSEQGLQQHASTLVEHYLKVLTAQLRDHFSDEQLAALAGEYRQLFAVSWADFQRFLAGWQDPVARISNYSKCQIQQSILQQKHP